MTVVGPVSASSDARDLPATRRRPDTTRRRAPVDPLRARWVALMTGTAWLGYTAVGLWLVHGRDFMINDAISRTVSAKLMVLSRDPHLGAVGFYWMPFPTVSRVPFVLLLDPFGATLMAGPVVSALFAGATVPVLVAIGRELQLRRPLIATIVGVLALNPVVVFGAASGMSESTFGFFASLAFLLYLRWRATDDTRALLMFGLAVAGCLACRFETLVVLPVLLFGVGARVRRTMRRDAVALAGLPSIALFVLWTFASAVVVGDGLYWYSESRVPTATPPDAQWLPDDLDAVNAAGHVARLVLVLAPALVPAIATVAVHPLRWRISTMFLGATLVLPVVVTWQLADRSTWMVPRFLGHLPLFATVTTMWLWSTTSPRSDEVMRLGRDARRRVGVALAATTALCLPAGALASMWYLADTDRSHAEGEYILMSALLGRGDPRSGSLRDGSNEVFTADLETFRELTDELERRLDESGGRVVMDSLQAIPIALAERPDRFIVPEDRDFEEILSDPIGRFDHVVVLDGRAPTEFSELIAEELDRTEGGAWREVARFDGAGRIFRFEAA